MIFNSIQFLVFFVFVTILYFQLPHRLRWFLLLAASCYFYIAFKPIYILILGFTIVVDYFAGILLEKTNGQKKKFYLLLSLIANIGVLVVFKYYNFISFNFNELSQLFHSTAAMPHWNILLPIGLSFHTFQAMSYTIEVYRGNQKAERNFGIYSLYVMFYPQLVAGPIERPQNLIHQFHEKHNFNYEKCKSGLMLMAFGFFKKVVIADRLGMMVDYSFNNIGHLSGLSMLLAVCFYSFQIYCDFSGYSEIAIGAARVMGFDLMENFNAPYLSKSVAEFWKRWHISLSTWFRDYLYIPLGGNRVSRIRWFFNLSVVFIISGLWHGANWTFIIWGALHALYFIVGIEKERLLAYKKISQKKNRFTDVVNIISTFALVTLAWIFFRSDNLGQAAQVFHKIGEFRFDDAVSLGLHFNEIVFSILLILLLLIKERFWKTIRTDTEFRFYFGFLSLVLLAYLFGVFNQRQFIYFQF